MRNSMDDLISRAAAVRIIADMHGLCRYDVLRESIQAIKELPAVDDAPVVHGHWKDNGNGTVSCSCCATWFQKEREPYLLYCGYCGARMDSGRSDDNG